MQVYEPVHERFERYCKTRMFGGEQFKDVMHDTLLIAFEKFETLKTKEVFLHFLFGIATRVLSNQRKKKQPEFVEHLSAELKNVQNDEQSIRLCAFLDYIYCCLWGIFPYALYWIDGCTSSLLQQRSICLVPKFTKYKCFDYNLCYNRCLSTRTIPV